MLCYLAVPLLVISLSEAITGKSNKILVLPITNPEQYEIKLQPLKHKLIDITVCTWIASNAVFVKDTPLLTLSDSTGSNSLEIIVTLDSVWLRTGGGEQSESYNFSASAVTPTKWYHLCASLQNSRNYKIYIDGTLTVKGSFNTPLDLSGLSRFLIGNAGKHAYVFSGKLSALNIYSRVYPDDTVQKLSCGTCQEVCASRLLLRWSDIQQQLATKATFIEMPSIQYISPPSNISVVLNNIDMFISVSWNKVLQDNQYRYYIVSFKNSSIVKSEIVASTSYTISNLKPFAKYDVKLATKSRCGIAEWSIPVTITALPKPVYIRKLRATSVSNDTITVAWQPPKTQIVGYRTTLYSTLDSGNQNHKVISSGYSSYTFHGLLSNTEYSIQVGAKTKYADGKYSSITVTTQPNEMSLSLSAHVVPRYKVELSWELSYNNAEPLPPDSLYVVYVERQDTSSRDPVNLTLLDYHNHLYAEGSQVDVEDVNTTQIEIRTKITKLWIRNLTPGVRYGFIVKLCVEKDGGSNLKCLSESHKKTLFLLDTEYYYYQQYYRYDTELSNREVQKIFRAITEKSNELYKLDVESIAPNSFFGHLEITAKRGEEIVPGNTWLRLMSANGTSVNGVSLKHFNLHPTDKTGHCEQDVVTIGGKGEFLWPFTSYNRTIVLPCNLRNSSSGMRERRCSVGGEWRGEGDYSHCLYQDDMNGEMHQLINSNITSTKEAEKVSERLNLITTDQMTSETISLASKVIDHIITSTINSNLPHTKTVAENLVGSLNNIQGLSQEKLSGETAYKAQKIVSDVEEYCINIDDAYTSNENVQELINVAKPNLKINVMRFSSAAKDGNVYINSPESPGSTIQHSDQPDRNSSGIEVVIPATNTAHGRSLLTAIYNDKSMFQVANSTVARRSFGVPTLTVSMQDANHTRTHHLQDDITFTIVTNRDIGNQHLKCVYWNTTTKDWSDDGIRLVYSTRNKIMCQSNHLTSFSALLLPLQNDPVLDVLSQVGSVISIICLAFTIILLTVVRSVRECTSTKIHINLSLSLFCALSIYILNGSITLNKTLCKVVACLTHYFFLATFCWMVAEAVGLYRAVVLVFTKTSNNIFIITTAAVSWGLPCIIVTVLASIRSNVYLTHPNLNLCWLQKDWLYGAFIAPLVLMIAFNTFIFVRVLWKVIGAKSSSPGQRGKRNHIVDLKIIFSIMTLLGLTWIFGVIQVTQPHIAVQYMFVLTNTLQGVSIFVFYCLCNQNIRMAMWRVIHGYSINRSSFSSNSGAKKKKVSLRTRAKRRISIVKTHIDGNPFAFSFGPQVCSDSEVKINRKKWKKLKKGDIEHTFNRHLRSMSDEQLPGATVIAPTTSTFTKTSLLSNSATLRFSSSGTSKLSPTFTSNIKHSSLNNAPEMYL